MSANISKFRVSEMEKCLVRVLQHRRVLQIPVTKFVEVNVSEVVMTLFIVNKTLISLKIIIFYIFCI